MTPNPEYAVFQPAAPYFDLVRKALGDLVDGDHFFDALTGASVYEVLYDVPGWPRIITGRNDLMAAFRGYVGAVSLHAADNLTVHKTDGNTVIVMEYEVHGTILANRVAYHNRFCSIVRTAERKIAYWRDYMDSLAAWNALTAQTQG